MNDTTRWSRWYDHDGCTPVYVQVPGIPNPCQLEAMFLIKRAGREGIVPSPNEMTDSNHPCWNWRMKRVWVGLSNGFWERVPVCYQEEYAPITRFRFRLPPKRRVSVERVEEILDIIRNPGVLEEV